MDKIIETCGGPLERIFLHWHITNWCNYRCSYCPVLQQLTSDFRVEQHAPYKYLMAKLDHIDKPFRICITGGEPTLHPDLHAILNRLADNPMCEDIAMFTNLTRPVKFFEKLNELKEANKIAICASYHPENVKIDVFTERCIAVSKLQPINFSVHVNLVEDKNEWDKSENFIKTMKDLGIDVNPTLLSANENYTPNPTQEFYDRFHKYFETGSEVNFRPVPVTYTDGTSEILKDFEFEMRNLNKFKGYRCTPNTFQILMDGTIINSCNNSVLPLYLKSKNILKEIDCPVNVCPSRAMLQSPKKRQ